MKNEFRAWSNIRVFLAVFRTGSTLAASRRLGIAQPTVARQIEALEHAIGLTLFERNTRGFQPTEHAHSLAPMAEAVELAVGQFSATAEDLSSTRPIRITAFSGNFSPRVNQIFTDFSALHPDIQFEFLPSVTVLDLAAGEADIALRLTRVVPDENLICRKVSTAQFALYGSREYQKQHGLPTSVNDFDGHKFLSFVRSGVPPVFDEWLRQHVPDEQIIMSFGEIDLMHAAIRAGHGLGIINVRLAEAEEQLIRCFEPIEEFASQHLILVAPEAYRRAEIRTFTKFFAPRYANIFK